MFFLARSAICIGLVAFLLPASESDRAWQGFAESAETAAASQFQALCGVSSTGCAEAGIAKLLSAGRIGADHSAARRKSISTLALSDLAPAWKDPAPRS